MIESIQLSMINRRVSFNSSFPTSRLKIDDQADVATRRFSPRSQPKINVSYSTSPQYLTNAFIAIRESVLGIDVYETEIQLTKIVFIGTNGVLFANGYFPLVQSPNLTWWKISCDQYGVMGADQTTFSGTLWTSDYPINFYNLFGIIDSTGIWNISINNGIVVRNRLSLNSISGRMFSSNQAFQYPFGFVFSDSIHNYRLGVSDQGVVGASLL